jgi:serine phosphatase RsbU (regulator of sigma subunit)/CheY-like chemotaxis protein
LIAEELMRILVGWDDPDEAETIQLMLDVDDNISKIVTDSSEFEHAAVEGGWDVFIQALSFPDREESLEVLERMRSQNGEVPVIGIWRQDEIADLARFMSHGLHSHLMRDSEGNYMLLLTSMATAAKTAVQGKQAALMADRLREEVDSVRKLQESVIPHKLPQPHSYRLAARYESSQINVTGVVPVAMAGGDYYDVFETESHSLNLIVGDASGHGIKACMSIMTMHTLIRMINWLQYPDTGSFVTEVNRRLCSSDIVQDEGGFITLFYSRLDIPGNKLQWTSAGSPMPLLQNLKTNEITIVGGEDHAGLPLAIEESWEYQHFELPIPPHSRLLVYTDGLEEAFPLDEDGHHQFGVEGIVASLQSAADLPLEEALDKLFDDSNAFTHGHGRMDDTSVLLVERID